MPGTAKHALSFRVVYTPSDGSVAKSAARCGDLTQARTTVENLRAVMPGKFRIQRVMRDGTWVDVEDER
jgi:multidrug resistance efflux pump